MILGKEPAIIIGGIAAALSIAGTLIAGGGLDDGLQLEEVVAIAAPVLAIFGIRASVFSPETVATDPAVVEKARRKVGR